MITTENKKPNRLIHEKSPYLLQHAHNPVDWYPWGEEAFRRATAQDKPVFLSIGYSACHWCHVMEHESFEDEEVAGILNEFFIPIKVDREERPDVDAVYMKACQALTGSGGWPLTIVMSPDQKPFYAGTYLPKYERLGSMGLLDVLGELARQWKTSRERLLSAGEEISRYLRKEENQPVGHEEPTRALLKSAAAQLKSMYDEQYGGFGGAPKFPTPHNLMFLFRYAELEGYDDARKMAEHTLQHMYRGGIFDHIGGGFSRYSTDRKWLVPHFEKMLYDNALLTIACLDAYRSSKNDLYQEIVRRTLDYVLREMTDETGGFYCSQDADSEGEEGKYYTFTPNEIKKILAKKDGEEFCRCYGIKEPGNFLGKSIPNLLEKAEFEHDMPKMEELRRKLYEYRFARRKLPLDDKILTAWNALMAAAMVRAGNLLHEPRYLTAGRQALRFIENRLTAPDGRLKVRFRDGEATGDGHLDDYAYYAWALLELYRVTLDAEDLYRAVEVAGRMCGLFMDQENGGFYLYASDGEKLISRPKETYDGAMPSGNSVAALVLGKLWRLTGETVWRDWSEKQLRYLAGIAKGYPSGYCFALLAIAEELYPTGELLCASGVNAVPEGLKTLRDTHEHLAVLLKTPENEELLKKTAPFAASCPIPDKGVIYYFCRDGACSAPTEEITQVRSHLKGLDGIKS